MGARSTRQVNLNFKSRQEPRSTCLGDVVPEGNLRMDAQVYVEGRSGLQIQAGSQDFHLADLGS